jgi:hypothetical protein
MLYWGIIYSCFLTYAIFIIRFIIIIWSIFDPSNYFLLPYQKFIDVLETQNLCNKNIIKYFLSLKSEIWNGLRINIIKSRKKYLEQMLFILINLRQIVLFIKNKICLEPIEYNNGHIYKSLKYLIIILLISLKTV